MKALMSRLWNSSRVNSQPFRNAAAMLRYFRFVPDSRVDMYTSSFTTCPESYKILQIYKCEKQQIVIIYPACRGSGDALLNGQAVSIV